MKKITKKVLTWGSVGVSTVVVGFFFLKWNMKSGKFPKLMWKKKSKVRTPIPSVSKKIPQEEMSLPKSRITSYTLK